MVTLPSNDGRDVGFNTLRMMWWATFISEISAGLSDVGGPQCQKIHSLPAFLPSALLYYDDFPTLFSILFVSGYHFCPFSLPAASAWRSFLLAGFFPLLLRPPFSLSFYLATHLPVPLLPVFVLLSDSLLVLWTHFFLQLLPAYLSTTFQKWDSKTSWAIWWQVLKVLSDPWATEILVSSNLVPHSSYTLCSFKWNRNVITERAARVLSWKTKDKMTAAW